MNLLLHIGTHKTATTSIQHFCTRNADVLAKQGFYYPQSPFSAYEHNFIPDKLSRGDTATVREFIKKSERMASSHNCHTIVISAESFYAMAGFFLTPRIKKGSGKLVDFVRSNNYWEEEKRLIVMFKECCNQFENIKIVGYVRPQDEFAFSIYNQLVKNVFGTSASFEEIVVRMREVFDYHRHFSIWSDVFGGSQVFMNGFNECKHDIIKQFCYTYLSSACYDEAKQRKFESNTRLTRDVLEARRRYLETDYDVSAALVTARAFIGLCNQYPDKDDSYQIYGSKSFRSDFFSEYEKGNGHIASQYNLQPFHPLNEADEVYAGLSDEKFQEVLSKVNKEISRPSRRIIIHLKQAYRLMVTSFPLIKPWIAPAKSYVYALKLRRLGW